MKLTFIPFKFNISNNKKNLEHNTQNSYVSNNIERNNISSYNNTEFNGLSNNYFKAKNYLAEAKKDFDDVNNIEIYDLDLNKLDGIQEGIKVFKGLNMKEIAFIGSTINEVAINRGCHNICSHCYAGANPPIREDNKHINKMSWNDFKTLTDGFKELNNRLGFPITRDTMDDDPYMTSFHDADCIDIKLKDNEGNEHDFIDIALRLNDAFGKPKIFDTAGWSPNDKKAQARAEKYAEYYSDPEHFDEISDFNVSINPYHALHTREVMLRKDGNIEKAEKFRDLYTTRMANVLFTFTPLLDNPKFNFIARAADNSSKGTEGFKEEDLRNIYDEIFNKLEKRYQDDFNGEQNIIADKQEIKQNIYSYKRLLGHVNTNPSISERLNKIYSPDNSEVKKTDIIIAKSRENVMSAKNIHNILNGETIKLNAYETAHPNYAGLIDSNGKYYITNYYTTYPTELQLNFENKDKQTAPIHPYLNEDLPIKKTLINSL